MAKGKFLIRECWAGKIRSKTVLSWWRWSNCATQNIFILIHHLTSFIISNKIQIQFPLPARFQCCYCPSIISLISWLFKTLFHLIIRVCTIFKIGDPLFWKNVDTLLYLLASLFFDVHWESLSSQHYFSRWSGF